MYDYVIQFKLWSKVKQPEVPSRFYRDCWEWTGHRHTDRNGKLWHGFITHKGKTFAAHRVAYELAAGKMIPEGLVVRHKCNMPNCVNPQHLETGTPADNVKDRVAARRSATGKRNGAHTKPENRRKGETHGNARLSEHDIQAIRNTAAKFNGNHGIRACLARKFDVSNVSIGRIVTRQAWVHVPDDPSVPALNLINGESNLRRGERHGMSQTDARTVQELRYLYEQNGRKLGAITALAERYGINKKRVNDIIRRNTWKHVPDDFTGMEHLEPLPDNPLVSRENNHGGSKLTPDVVREIRAKHAEGIQQKELCKIYGITAGPMSALINHKTWASI